MTEIPQIHLMQDVADAHYRRGRPPTGGLPSRGHVTAYLSDAGVRHMGVVQTNGRNIDLASFDGFEVLGAYHPGADGRWVRSVGDYDAPPAQPTQRPAQYRGPTDDNWDEHGLVFPTQSTTQSKPFFLLRLEDGTWVEAILGAPFENLDPQEW